MSCLPPLRHQLFFHASCVWIGTPVYSLCILLTFTEFRVNSREVAVFVPLVVSLRNMRRMPSTTLDPDIDEAAGRLEGEVGDKAAG